MIVIVWVVTIFQDLFVAVAAGVAVTALAYAWDMGERFTVSSKLSQNGTTKIYTVHGPGKAKNHLLFLLVLSVVSHMTS